GPVNPLLNFSVRRRDGRRRSVARRREPRARAGRDAPNGGGTRRRFGGVALVIGRRQTHPGVAGAPAVVGAPSPGSARADSDAIIDSRSASFLESPTAWKGESGGRCARSLAAPRAGRGARR